MIHSNKRFPSKVLHLIDTLGTGGAQMVLYQMAKFVDREKYAFTICGCLKSGHYEDVFKEEGYDVESISINRRSIILFPFFLYDVTRIIFKLLKIIRNRKIDIIHTNLQDSNIYGVIAGKLSGKPVVITIHSNNMLPYNRSAPIRNWLRKKVIKTIFSQAKVIICVGEDVAKNMIEQGYADKNAPIVVVMNGIDHEKFAENRDAEQIKERLGLPAGSKVVSCVSRLEEIKGLTYLVRATALLSKKIPLLRVLVVGDGSLLNELQEEAKKAGVEEQIRFLERRADVPDILSASDIFVLPSLYEGVPLVVLEAFASQKPVVATNIPGTRELITDGEDGFLVAAKDEVGLAYRIEKLLSDHNLRLSMGKAGRVKVEKQFTAKMMVKKVEAVYENILEEQ